MEITESTEKPEVTKIGQASPGGSEFCPRRCLNPDCSNLGGTVVGRMSAPMGDWTG